MSRCRDSSRLSFVCLTSLWRILAIGVFQGEFCQGPAAPLVAGRRTLAAGGLIDCWEALSLGNPEQRAKAGTGSLWHAVPFSQDDGVSMQ